MVVTDDRCRRGYYNRAANKPHAAFPHKAHESATHRGADVAGSGKQNQLQDKHVKLRAVCPYVIDGDCITLFIDIGFQPGELRQ